MGMLRQQPACHSGTVEDNKDVNDIRIQKLSHTVDAVLLSYFFCRIQNKEGEKGKRKECAMRGLNSRLLLGKQTS